VTDISRKQYLLQGVQDEMHNGLKAACFQLTPIQITFDLICNSDLLITSKYHLNIQITTTTSHKNHT